MEEPRICLPCLVGEHAECSKLIMGQSPCMCYCAAPKPEDHYFLLDEIIKEWTMPENQKKFKLLYSREIVQEAFGSSHNHQAWSGGYVHHVQETCNIAHRMYKAFPRQTPFSFVEAIEVLLLHDIEKPWKVSGQPFPKKDRQSFRMTILQSLGIYINVDQANALRYCEGEGDDYSSHERKMSPLAAFCHMADIASARIWFDKGQSQEW
jgi:hypothetical protein